MSDRNAVAFGTFFVTSIAYLLFLIPVTSSCYNAGEDNIKAQAVKNGDAEYITREDGSEVFWKWKTKRLPQGPAIAIDKNGEIKMEGN